MFHELTRDGDVRESLNHAASDGWHSTHACPAERSRVAERRIFPVGWQTQEASLRGDEALVGGEGGAT